jgi:DNA polymerase III epsilon subunit-like protein
MTYRIIFFDTETTGLPKDRNINALLQRDNWPDLVSISWIVYDGEERVSKESYIIRPQGWSIPADVAKIHGITDEIAHERGESLRDVLRAFTMALRSCNYVVAHNMKFDRNVLHAAYKWRLNADPREFWSYKAEICTMILSKNELRLPSKYPKPNDPYKMPRLDELYEATFRAKAPAGAHSADRDTEVLVAIFWARWKSSYI